MHPANSATHNTQSIPMSNGIVQDDTIRFIHATPGSSRVLEVPLDQCRRSKLINGMLDFISTTADAVIPIPHGLDDLQAWYGLLRSRQAELSRTFPRLETLLRAFKMSDFLVDEDTASRAVDLLGQVVVPSHTAMVGKRRFFDSAPSELQRESVQKIVSELPVEVVGRILAAARPTADACGEATLETARAQAQTLGHLLLLMPPACHPAVLAARFPGLTADGTLVLPRMPVHAALDDSCPTAASLSVHALAAAALFADGCPAAVWSDFSAVGDATKLSMRPLPLERLSASQSGRLGAASSSLPAKHQQKFARLPTSAAEVEEAEAHVAGELCAAWESTMPPPADAAWLTRLHFEVPVCQSSRWCSALAQLRTLCSLHLHVAQVHDICVAPFAWALRALPSLSDLQVTAERAAAIEELRAVKLLQAVAGVTQLSTLHMHQCYSEKLIFRRTAKSPYPGSQLSCLTALTELVLSGNELKDVSIRGLCCAVACMPRLRRLSLMNGWHAERVVVALGHVRHAALHSLELVNSLSGDNTVFAELSREPVIQALTRLTALSFAANHMPFWIWHKVPDILRRTPMLLSLVVQESLQDSGLLLLASLLPGLRYLIRLDISNNYATYMGVSAVLAAAAAVQASGGAGLRCLAMHATQIGPTNALQLADLLLQLPTLEEVGMQHTGVPFEATMELIHELCGLPRLQSLAPSLPRFTGAGARKLAPAIARLPSLRRLTLQGVRLSCVSSVHGILVNGSPGVSVDLRDLNGLRE